MTLLPQLLWLAAPVLLTGMAHLVVLQRDWLPSLRRAPIDFGARFRGRRVFGDNKTWRGALVMVLGTAACSSLLAHLNAAWLHWPVAVEFAQAQPALWGALLGCGYIVGELPNSFIKRQLDIAPGAMGQGVRGKVFWVVDQLDSLAGMLLCVSIVWRPSPAVVVASALVMLALHPLSAWVMMRAGLKDRVG